jgi:hypothetical protein
MALRGARHTYTWDIQKEVGRMKRILLTVAVFACLTAPASATSFAVYASGWNPDALEEALGAGATISFGETLGFDLRAAYYQEGDVQDLRDDNDPDGVFPENALQIVPIDAAVRYNLNSDGAADFWFGGGASYYFLSLEDDNFEIDDEVGWLAFAGARFGDPEGMNFFVEGVYRGAEGTVVGDDLDPDTVEDEAKIDLNGPQVNAGIVWTF